MKNVRKQKNNKGLFGASIVGLGCAMFLTIICTGLLSVFVSNDQLSLHSSSLAVVGVQVLATFVGCCVSGKVAGENKVAAMGVVGASYYVILLGVSALFLEGISDKFWVGLATTAVGCFAAALLVLREKSVKRRGKRRRAYS